MSIRVDFIAGMARSGTTWLGRALAAHPDVAVFGETSFFGRLYVPPRADGAYGPDELGRLCSIQRRQDWRTTTGDDADVLHGDYATLVDSALGDLRTPAAPADAFRRLARAVAESEGKPRAVEKTPHHVHWLSRIAAGFPEARFVLLTRDPYGFMLSLEHLGDRLGTRWQRALERPWHHPALCALAWRGYALSVERALDRHGDRILVVDHADLRARPEEQLARVQGFLDLEVLDLAPDAAERNTSFPDGRRPTPTARDVFWMNLVAGRTMRRTGYAPRPVPFRPLTILVSCVTLPFCLAYAAVRLPARVPGSFRAYVARWLGR